MQFSDEMLDLFERTITSEFTFLRKEEQEDIVGFLLCFEQGITIDDDCEKVNEETIRVRMKAIEKKSRG